MILVSHEWTDLRGRIIKFANSHLRIMLHVLFLILFLLFFYPFQRELLRSPKLSPEVALKTILSSLSLPASMPLARLGIFRWAHQVAATNVNHPLLPLLFQRFFAGD